MSRRRTLGPSRLGTLLLLVGCFTVLGGTFAAGILAGRSWPRLVPALGPGALARRDIAAPRGRQADTRGGERTRAVEPAPVLTFYQELTAPLTAPPPPAPKPKTERKTPPPAAEPSPIQSIGETDAATRSSDSPPAALREQAAPATTSRFTVQVGAFNVRAQADALRTTLAAAGYDAYVTEAEGPSGTRYRVRVGSFASRDDASRAAERLGAERKLATYVTTR